MHHEAQQDSIRRKRSPPPSNEEDAVIDIENDSTDVEETPQQRHVLSDHKYAMWVSSQQDDEEEGQASDNESNFEDDAKPRRKRKENRGGDDREMHGTRQKTGVVSDPAARDLCIMINHVLGIRFPNGALIEQIAVEIAPYYDGLKMRPFTLGRPIPNLRAEITLQLMEHASSYVCDTNGVYKLAAGVALPSEEMVASVKRNALNQIAKLSMTLTPSGHLRSDLCILLLHTLAQHPEGIDAKTIAAEIEPYFLGLRRSDVSSKRKTMKPAFMDTTIKGALATLRAPCRVVAGERFYTLPSKKVTVPSNMEVESIRRNALKAIASASASSSSSAASTSHGQKKARIQVPSAAPNRVKAATVLSARCSADVRGSPDDFSSFKFHEAPLPREDTPSYEASSPPPPPSVAPPPSVSPPRPSSLATTSKGPSAGSLARPSERGVTRLAPVATSAEPGKVKRLLITEEGEMQTMKSAKRFRVLTLAEPTVLALQAAIASKAGSSVREVSVWDEELDALLRVEEDWQVEEMRDNTKLTYVV